MQLIKETHIDFMKYRKFWIAISLALVAFGVLAVFFHGWINLGIDFAGGTQITLKFKESPNVDEIRTLLEAEGIKEPVLQSFGDSADHELLLKTAAEEGTEEGSSAKVVAALDKKFNQELGGKVDLNAIGRDRLQTLLTQADPDSLVAQGVEAAATHYGGVAEAVMAARKTEGLISNWEQIAKAHGVSPKVREALEGRAALGDYSVLGVENVGPQIGEELRRQGLLAVFLSLLGILGYIAFRFEIRFGIGAVMASLHDVLVVLGFFSLMGYEFNLTTVAAFLTLIGYSVNDTVVIFDRVRENMRKSRKKPLIEVMNDSINQTLSRTLLTSGLTLLSCLALFFFGGDVLRGFSFVMVVGIIVGTYSTIYIASPFALLWEDWFGSEARARRESQKKAAAGATR